MNYVDVESEIIRVENPHNFESCCAFLLWWFFFFKYWLCFAFASIYLCFSNRQVSWVRLPDWRIVASGRHIYNKDERFKVLHAEGTAEWTLQIKYAALIDQGLYECQVSVFIGWWRCRRADNWAGRFCLQVYDSIVARTVLTASLFNQKHKSKDD